MCSKACKLLRIRLNPNKMECLNQKQSDHNTLNLALKGKHHYLEIPLHIAKLGFGHENLCPVSPDAPAIVLLGM